MSFINCTFVSWRVLLSLAASGGFGIVVEATLVTRPQGNRGFKLATCVFLLTNIFLQCWGVLLLFFLAMPFNFREVQSGTGAPYGQIPVLVRKFRDAACSVKVLHKKPCAQI